MTASTFRSRDFAKAYGVDITSGPLTGLTARAVVVLDENDKVLHAERVSEIKNEPNYDAALSALNKTARTLPHAPRLSRGAFAWCDPTRSIRPEEHPPWLR